MKSKTKKIIISAIVTVLILAIGGGAVYAVINRSADKAKYKDEQPGFEKFSYTLKEKYDSYDDVLTEMENMTRVYKKSIDGCSNQYIEESKKEYNKLNDQLQEELEKFPQKKKSSVAQKAEEIYSRCDFLKSLYIQEGKPEDIKTLYDNALSVKDKYESGEYTLDEAYEQMMAVKNPDYNRLCDELKFCEENCYANDSKGYAKELYDKALSIMEKYKNGELNLEEACEQMDYLRYPADGMLLTNIIYEQEAKENNETTYFKK